MGVAGALVLLAGLGVVSAGGADPAATTETVAAAPAAEPALPPKAVTRVQARATAVPTPPRRTLAAAPTRPATLVAPRTRAAASPLAAVPAAPRAAAPAPTGRPAAPAPRPPAAPRRDPDVTKPPGPVADTAPATTAAPADRYAFLVGVQRYRSPTKPTLASAEDVVLIRQALLAAGWLPQNIRVAVDGQATGDAIRSGASWLAAKSVPGKTFSFFHYSGHVKQFGNQNDALWPIDRDWVRDRELTSLLSRVRGRVWVDIAGCEAASFMPGLSSSRMLFTGSSKATEKSYEHPGWRTSVWTGLLFRTAPSRADANRDGRVVMGEALRYSQYYARVVTSNQRPYGPQTPQVSGDPERGWTLSDPPA